MVISEKEINGLRVFIKEVEKGLEIKCSCKWLVVCDRCLSNSREHCCQSLYWCPLPMPCSINDLRINIGKQAHMAPCFCVDIPGVTCPEFHDNISYSLLRT